MTISFLLFSGGRTIYQLGVVWPQNEEVAFVWQRDLTAAAAYLDERPQLSAATIVGWTPDTMDEPTMAVSRQRDDVQLRFTGRVGAVTTVVIPAAADGAAVVIRPSILPFEPALAEALARQGVEMAQPAEESIVVYRWTAPFAPRPAIEQTAVFADQLRLTGYEVQGDCGQTATPFCFVVSYWEVVGETADERRFFLHMVDESGEIIAQSDALDAPARYWRVGDQLLQVHALPTSSFSHALRLGVYDPRPPYAPLMTEEGVSFVTLSTKD